MGQNDVVQCFRVLYTKQLTKKQKTYQDGYVKVKADRFAVLCDADGNALSSTKLKITFSSESEGIGCFGGYVVNCDEECTVKDIPRIQKASFKEKPRTCKDPSSKSTLPPRMPCTAAMPKVGLKKRSRATEEVEQTKKQRYECDASDRAKQRTDGEILDLFLGAEKEIQECNRELKSKKLEKKHVAVQDLNRKPFKRPSVTRRSGGGRFGSDTLDLRFLLFGKKLERQVSIPDAFKCQEHYSQLWKAAIHEEMQLKLDACATRVGITLRHQDDERDRTDAGQTERNGSIPSTSEILRRHGIEYYDDCGISVFKKDKREDDLFFVEIRSLTDETKKAARSPSRLCSALNGLDPACRKHDMWIVSSDPVFMFKRVSYRGRVFDRVQGPWVAVFCSTWHGVTKEGKLQLDVISKQRPWKTCNKVYAIRGPPLALEMMLWEALDYVGGISESLRSDLIVKCPKHEDPSPATDHRPGSEEIVKRFGLNEDQASVIGSVSSWFLRESETLAHPSSTVCLIHGPFGTGKSSLLVAIIHLLCTPPLEDEGYCFRVLMCAHTNKAVDRIMEGLLETGFTDFIRVGLISKISPPVLPYSVYYASESNEDGNAAAELKRQLRHVQTPIEEAILRNELQEVEQGVVHKRREKLSTVKVVGVTCCSTNSSVLQGQTFDIVIVDEACQIVEPLSLLPLIKTEAKYLVAAGDPCQLPPVIAQPTEPTTTGHSISRSLFSRLHSLGHAPHLLRTQYRCHPDLSKVPNRYFYDNRLLNGCSSQDRAAVIPDWPALCHVQVTGTAMKHNSSSSYWNEPEALAVIKVLGILSRHGVPNDQIGVICFYRAQVNLIASLLSDKAQSIQVATVDSFQGMEKKVILLSMSVDIAGTFASDKHRLNVALTRAKNHLVIVGDKSVLSTLSPCMKDLLHESETISIA